ncbi:hypothetical protein [Hymenobacter siberiensis]|uniref:hypothetical protein n=1 Tax=Hymenobacter siberiensis TaxID=2848396 RepID=UPI001C1E3360|nr:hypothetical protein [Hymenobacter siberiensis]
MGLTSDLLKNDRGLFSTNMLMRLISYVIGAFLSVFVAIKYGPTLSIEVITINYALAFGLTGARMFEAFTNRKTKDADGALMQAGTAEAPAQPVIPAEKDDLTAVETKTDS